MTSTKSKDGYSDYIKGSLQDQLDKGTQDRVQSIYKRITPTSELELMFYNYRRGDPNNLMGFENFKKVLEYLTYRHKAQKLILENTATLDVSYTQQERSTSKKTEKGPPSTRTTYRISVSGTPAIKKYTEMLHQRKNHVVFSVLAGSLDKDKDLTVIKKTKTVQNIEDINDFNIRVRMADEEEVTKKELAGLKDLEFTTRDSISFRYKQRASLILTDTPEATIRIDLTNTKSHSNLNRLNSTYSTYELEIDLSSKKGKPPLKHLDTLYKEATVLLKILQQSNFIIGESLSREVVARYCSLVGVDPPPKTTNLEGRKAVSLEVQHVTDKLPNNYAVTDKADGDRFNLIVYKNTVFLISDNLHVKNTGILLSTKLDKYNDTLLDGELIFLPKKNRHIFMVFDCMFKGGQDTRPLESFLERLSHADDIIDACFVEKTHAYTKLKQYSGKFDLDKILEFHANQIVDFMGRLNKDIDSKSNTVLIRRKYFIPCIGAQDTEIFNYSQLMWNLYVLDNKTGCPYILDGLVYHPLNQKYDTTKNTRFLDYKWKPPEKNTIDFFLTFQRRRDNNKVYTLYDNSEDSNVRGKPYKIAHLHVGQASRAGERPTLFEPREERYIAKLFLTNGEVRDEEGHMVRDRTVVEAYYNTDPSLLPNFRWTIMRTRHDKTESVQRFNKRFGNYVTTAKKVWRSIVNPVLMSDFAVLSDKDTYHQHIATLRGKIDHSIVVSEAKENAFYQRNKDIAKPMRGFHNWLKSTIIYTYCNPSYDVDRRFGQLNVLDIGVGRGGDLKKFYYPRGIKLYVGIDIDNYNLYHATDGAISRYNKFRNELPNFPQMHFVQADGGAILDLEDQTRVIGAMSDQNKSMLLKFFSKDKSKRTIFDRINSSFVIHFMLRNQTTWTNFMDNLNMYLRPGGYFFFETFDAQRVVQALKETGKHTLTYTDRKGDKQVLHDIERRYPADLSPDKPIGVGHQIDVFNSIYSQDGRAVSEFLVDWRFLQKELLKHCNMVLVDTDLFENQYNIHRDFFSGPNKLESNKQTRGFLDQVSKFYNLKDEVNRASLEITKLNRIYIFKKLK